MQTKNATGNLINRYRAVLKKCTLLNVFGSLIIAGALTLSGAGVGIALAASVENPAGQTETSMDASSLGTTEATLINNGTINPGDEYTLGGTDVTIGMNGTHDELTTKNYTFTNNGTINIELDAIEARTDGIQIDGPGEHTVLNTGTITTTTTATSGADTPYLVTDGMDISGTVVDITNAAGATITATTHAYMNSADQSLKNDARSYGMYADATQDATITNHGSVTVSAEVVSETSDDSVWNEAYVYGMQVNGSSGNTRNVTNYGTLSTSATSTSNASDSYAAVYAIDSNDDINSILNNHGIITATATSHTTATSGDGTGSSYSSGIYADDDADHTLINTNSITATATATSPYEATAVARGLFADEDGSHIFMNDTNALLQMTATATSLNDYGYAYAVGMRADEDGGDHQFDNKGRIIAKATASGQYSDAYAIGMRADEDGDNRLTNHAGASITATAKGTSTAGYVDTFAYGLYADEGGDQTLTNNGSITLVSIAEAIGGYAGGDGYGLRVGAAEYSTYTLTNTGTIDIEVTATADASNTATAKAYGFFVTTYGSGTADAIVLSNTGKITVSATSSTAGQAFAYEAYGKQNYSVDTWATTLRTWSANDAVFGAEQGVVVNLDGANLILRPGEEGQGFVMDKAYDIANMVAIDTDPDENVFAMEQQTKFETGKLEGIIQSVATETPLLVAELIDGDTDNPKVKLSLAEQNAPNLPLTAQALETAIEQLGNISDKLRSTLIKAYSDRLLVDAGTSSMNAGSMADDYKWTMFATPYGSYTNNSEYDFDSSSFGLTGGASYLFTPEFELGFHFDFNFANSDDQHLDYDHTSMALGVHSTYFMNKQWYIGGQATLAYSANDATYRVAADSAYDEYSSYGFFAAAKTGYVFEINKNNIIVPEIGLSYIYSHTGSYAFAFANLPAYNMSIDSQSHSALFADAKLTWQGNWALDSGMIAPTLGVGVRQHLTDSDVDSSIDFSGTRYDTTLSSDDTTFLAKAGLEWTYDQLTLGAYYDGEYGSDQQTHTGSIKVLYRF